MPDVAEPTLTVKADARRLDASAADVLSVRVRAGLTAVCELAQARFAEALALGDLADAAGLPVNTLTRAFHKTYGMSPMRWLWSFRTMLAAEIIREAPEWSLTDVATWCGFNSSAHFSRRFTATVGETPSRFRARYAKAQRSATPEPAAPGAVLARVVASQPDALERALARLAPSSAST
jgi:transcriptional regulator GlxA family with amidase domain